AEKRREKRSGESDGCWYVKKEREKENDKEREGRGRGERERRKNGAEEYKTREAKRSRKDKAAQNVPFRHLRSFFSVENLSFCKRR
ncbi:hypothetical protein ALC57_16261, partial [Trachymyrmex cornetzi]